MSMMDDKKIDPYRNGDYVAGIKGLKNMVRETGAFRVHELKAISATERYTTALRKQDITFKDVVKNAKIRNDVLKEQWKLQNAVAMGWKEDGLGRMTADLFIPRGVPENIDNLRKRWSELSGTAGRFGTVVSEQRMRLGLFSQAVQSASHNLINWGKNTQWAGRQMMVGLSIPMIALGAVTGTLAYTIDKELTRILKVYDYATDQIEVEGERLRQSSMETAKFMAKNYAQAAEDTLAVTAALAATGQTGTGLQRATEIVGRGMFLGDLNQEDAVKTAIALQTVYRKEGETTAETNERLAESFDYLNAIENATNLQMKDMTIAIPKLAGVVNALGGSVQDIGTLMTAATAGGIPTAEAANALKTVLFRSVSPNKIARESFMEKTGQDIDDLIKRTNGEAIPTLIELGKAMQGLENVEKAGFLKDFFGIYQGSKAGIISSEMLNIADNTTQVGRAYEVANQEASKWAETRQREEAALRASASGKFKIALESLKTELAEMGEPFLNIASTFLKTISWIINKFNDLPDFAKTSAFMVAGFIAIAGPAIMITGVLANMIGTIINLTATLGNLIGRYKAVDAAQHAETLLAKQSALAWRDQATAGMLLSAQIGKISQELTAMGQAQALAMVNAGQMVPATNGNTPFGPNLPNVEKRVDKTGRARYYSPNEAGKLVRVSDRLGEATERSVRNAAELSRETASVAANTGSAAKGMGRFSGGTLAAVGSMGMLMSGTNRWVLGLSTALMLFGSLNLAGKGLAMQQAISNSLIQAHRQGLHAAVLQQTKLGKLTRGTGAGLKAFATSLAAAAGPLGIAVTAIGTIAATLVFIKNDSDKAVENFESMGAAAEKAAEALGVTYKDNGIAEGAVGEVISSRQKLTKELKTQLELIDQMKPSQQQAEIQRIGLEFYLGTGSSEEANRMMEMIAEAAGLPIPVKIKFEEQGAKEILGSLEQEIENITSRNYSKTAMESITGMTSNERWFKFDSPNKAGVSRKAAAAGKREAEILSKAFNAAVADQDLDGAQQLLDKAESIFRKNALSLVNQEWIDEKKFFEAFGFSPTNLKKMGELVVSESGLERLKDEGFGNAITYQLRDAAWAYQEYLRTVATGQGMTKGAADEIDYIEDILDKIPNSSKGAASGLRTTSGAMDELGDSSGELVGELTDAQTKIRDLMKETMGTVWSNTLDEIADTVDRNHQSAMDNIESAGQARVDRLEAEGDLQEKRFESRGKALDKAHQAQDRNFTKNWEDRTEAVENSYESRVKGIEQVMDAEEKAEEARERAFEAEKNRIQRLSELENKNIDINSALNSGDLDEAAKIANDVRATQQQWGLDDAALVAGNASEKRREIQQAQIEALNTQKDAALEALEIQEEAAKLALQERQEREKEALENEKERSKEALESRIKDEEAKTKAAVDGANASYEAAKRSLDLELAYARSMTPRNVQEMQAYLSEIQARYGAHGITLDLRSKEWADYVSRAIASSSETAKRSLADEGKWREVGLSIGDEIAQGMLGMNFDQFITWMKTGELPKDQTRPGNTSTSALDSPEARARALARNTVSATTARQNAAMAQRNRNARHGGGPVNGRYNNRGGRPMSAGLYSDEVDLTLQKGEFVFQKSAVQKWGIPTLLRMNNGETGPDKTGRMHQGGIVDAIGMMARSAFTNGLQASMAMGAMRNIQSGAQTPSRMAMENSTLPAWVGTGAAGGLGGSLPIQSRTAIPAGRVGQNGMLPPEALASIGGGHRLAHAAAAAWNRLVAETGRRVGITDSYRTYAQQVDVKRRKPSLAATPGTSNHGWGTALDLVVGGFGSETYQWLMNNAPRYGWNNPAWARRGGSKPEPWHWEYRHGGGPVDSSMTRGLRNGGLTQNTGFAKLHPQEAVLTKPLTNSLINGINKIDQGVNNQYHVEVNLYGAVNSEIDIEKAIQKALRKNDSKMGIKRVVD